jgi:DNA-binding beta-propeller fold protein YncE
MNCSISSQVRAAVVSGLTATAALLISGCGMGTGGTIKTVSTPILGSSFKGIVMGGQQPVGNVALQLYAVGATGYGSAAMPLLTSGPVVTTASGNFNIGTYLCPTPDTLVYLVGTGGQPVAAAGGGPAVTNNNLAMMVGLGACSSVGSQFIEMNELTTVATVWALSPFMSGIAYIGSTPTNPTGIKNAFASINTLVNTATGAIATPSGATLPLAEINTLADILAYCINTGGGSASDTTTTCGNLFNLSPNSAGTSYPSDTITAAMNIAQNPGRNVPALNQSRDTSPPYQTPFPVNTPPAAWTIMVNYTGGGLNAPTAIATDSAGAVWVTNGGNNSVSKFQANGSPASGSSGFTAGGGFSNPAAIAIDQSGNVWVANKGNSSITMLDPTGSTGTVYTGNGLNAPTSVAIDASGYVWVANSGTSSVSAFTSTGGTVLGSPYTGGGISSPVALAINPK